MGSCVSDNNDQSEVQGTFNIDKIAAATVPEKEKSMTSGAKANQSNFSNPATQGQNNSLVKASNSTNEQPQEPIAAGETLGAQPTPIAVDPAIQTIHAPKNAELCQTMNKIDPELLELSKKLPPFQLNKKQKKIFEAYPILGPYKFSDGSTYKGQFKEGKKHGVGYLVFQDGSGFQGLFKNDEKWGYGRIYYEDYAVYNGQIDSKGLRHGTGVLIFMNGTRYEGTFKNNVYHGKGK